MKLWSLSTQGRNAIASRNSDKFHHLLMAKISLVRALSRVNHSFISGDELENFLKTEGSARR